MNNPFKFLDSYTKADKEILFGRGKEIEQLYQKVSDITSYVGEFNFKF